MNKAILLWINQGWAHPWLDVLFRWLSSREFFGVPMFLLIMAILLKRWGRDGMKVTLLLMLCVGAGDLLGFGLKTWTAEPRPCYDLAESVRQPGRADRSPCSGDDNGMPSNHTLNFFTMAVFVAVVTKSARLAGPLLVVAALVGISRMYLGVHYPSQVAAGAVIGTVVGFLSAWAARSWLPFMTKA